MVNSLNEDRRKHTSAPGAATAIPVRTILQYLSAVFLGLTILAVFIPLAPKFPASDLDTSWMFAVNQAVAQGLVFGTDVVFTYGPYASVFTTFYHPATDRLMIGGALLFGACYFLSLLILAKGRNYCWLALIAFFLAGLMYSRDALLFSYPLLLALVTFRITSPESNALRLDMSGAGRVAYFALFGTLGLLPLIKVTLLPLSALVAGCCFLLLWRTPRPAFLSGSVVLLAPACGMMIWVLAGQPLSKLPRYVVNAAPIISGYTEAMSIPGPAKEIWLYLIASGFILLTIVVGGGAALLRRITLVLCYAVFLFIAFKNGFVRHDDHALVAATSIVLAAFTLPLVLQSNRLLIGAAIIASLVACIVIDKHWAPLTPARFVNNVVDTYAKAWGGFALRLGSPDRLRQKFDESLAIINHSWPHPELEGTADLYSYHQALLFAAGARWSPRPVLQGYSAYTKSLAKLNELHLRSSNAPDNILFRVESIDRRYPSLDDGYSWPAIINNYRPFRQDSAFVYLKRRASPHVDLPPVTVLRTAAVLGDEVAVPDFDEPLFAEIGISPAFAGRTLAFFYKPALLGISVNLANGTRRTYRLIPAMASAGFFLSPLVVTNGDFVLLGAGNYRARADRVVKSFVVFAAGGDSICWNRSYSVTLSRLDLVRDTVAR
jgi:hypothetical protein